MDALSIDQNMQRVVIYGAGGWARCCLQFVKSMAAAGTPIECVGFVVDPKFQNATTLCGLPIYTDLKWLSDYPDALVVVCVGEPAGRFRIVRRVEKEFTPKFATLVHPHASIGETVKVGLGSVLAPGVRAACDISFGAHNVINSNATIGHDLVLEDFATIAPSVNIVTGPRIREGAKIGAGAVIINKITIGRWSVVAAGAVVTRDVPDNAMVVGVPARVVSQRNAGWHLIG